MRRPRCFSEIGRVPRNADRRALLRTRPIPNVSITEPIRREFNSLVAVVLGGPRPLNSAHTPCRITLRSGQPNAQFGMRRHTTRRSDSRRNCGGGTHGPDGAQVLFKSCTDSAPSMTFSVLSEDAPIRASLPAWTVIPFVGYFAFLPTFSIIMPAPCAHHPAPNPMH